MGIPWHNDKINKLGKELNYWKEQADFRLKIIVDLEKQLFKNGIDPYSKTRGC